jgi:hypothetical protein
MSRPPKKPKGKTVPKPPVKRTPGGQFATGHVAYTESPGAPKGKRGPNKLDEDMLNVLREVANPQNKTPGQLFAGALKSGLPIHIAIERAGICRLTWNKWLAEAEAGDNPHPLLEEFAMLARMIQAETAARHMDNLWKVSAGERKGWWQGSAWWLERMEQDTFALKNKAPQNNEVHITVASKVTEAAEAAQAYAKLVEEQPITVEHRKLEGPETQK